MMKINQHYQSIYRVWLKKFSYASKIHRFFYPEHKQRYEDLKYSPSLPRDWQTTRNFNTPLLPLKGSMQAFLDMAKDTVDTFKPYKTNYQVKRDLSQPVRGLLNIGRAAATFVLALGFLVYRTGNGLFKKNHSYSYIKVKARYAFSWMAESMALALRGATQIATTPLTWLLKIPLRGILTYSVGAPLIEDSKSIQNLVELSKGQLQKTATVDSNSINTNAIRFELHRKYLKAFRRGQQTYIGHAEENKAFRNHGRVPYDSMSLLPGQEQAALKYLSLFSRENRESRASKQAVVPDTTGIESTITNPSSPMSSSTSSLPLSSLSGGPL